MSCAKQTLTRAGKLGIIELDLKVRPASLVSLIPLPSYFYTSLSLLLSRKFQHKLLVLLAVLHSRASKSQNLGAFYFSFMARHT